MELHLENFKSHTKSSYTLKDNVAITGRNGSGKTSILEAIMFALYGRNYSRGIAVDGLITKGKETVRVVLDTGTLNIKRSYGTTTGSEVTLDGKNVRQLDLAAKLPGMDLAYVLLNPLSLLMLPPLELRAYFMEHIPLPDPVEVFKEKYSNDPEFVERFKVGDYQQAKRALRSLEVSLDALNRDTTLKEAEVLANTGEIERINKSRVRRPKGVLKREEDRQKEIDALQERLGEAKGLKSELQSVKDQLNIVRKNLQQPLSSTGVESISELVAYHEKVVQSLSQKISDQSSVLTLRKTMKESFSSGGTCPLCNQGLEGLDFEELITSQINSTQRSLEELEKEYKEATSLLEAAQDVHREVMSLKKQKDNLSNRISRFAKVQDQLEDLKSKQKGLTEEDFRKAVESEAQIRMMRSLKLKTETAKKAIKTNKEAQKSLLEEVKVASMLCEALSPKGVEAVQAGWVGKQIEEELSKFFPGKKVKVSTVRENKSNDNYREVLDITLGGVHYINLSFGEKILMSVVLSLLLRRFVGSFPFNFLLLDEASVLSEQTLGTIIQTANKEGVDVIYTKADENDLNFRSIKYDRN